MIKQVIALLQIDEFYNQGELIEFAKGKYKLEENRKGIVNQKIRKAKWQSKK